MEDIIFGIIFGLLIGIGGMVIVGNIVDSYNEHLAIENNVGIYKIINPTIDKTEFVFECQQECCKNEGSK